MIKVAKVKLWGTIIGIFYLDEASAYDITFAYSPGNKWLNAHQMSINAKTAVITKEDMIKCGKSMDIKTSKCNRIIDEMYNIVQEFGVIARNVNIRDKTINLITSVLQKQHSQLEP